MTVASLSDHEDDYELATLALGEFYMITGKIHATIENILQDADTNPFIAIIQNHKKKFCQSAMIKAGWHDRQPSRKVCTLLKWLNISA
uniref:Uncharacterized protein n=1 Tax=Romanomermis culicivorax TaxID=13658 RepID=A0A915KXW3_ROMCU